jgi:uncharacterized membrane protein
MIFAYRIAVVFLILANTAFVLYQLPLLPEIIPTHFGANGQIDGWGSKYTILIPAGIQLLVNLLLEFLSRHPQMHNYMTKVTDENREKLFASSSGLLVKMNVAIGIIFMTISYSIVKQELPTLLIIAELMGLFGLIIVHMIQSGKKG